MSFHVEPGLKQISLLHKDIYSKNMRERERMLFYIRRALNQSRALIKATGIAEAFIS